jgi:adenosine deaminase
MMRESAPAASRDELEPQPEVVTEEVIRALPKADLHCHLDGSLRLNTILEMAEQQRVRLPADTPEGLREALGVGKVRESLNEYLTAFDITLSVLQTEESLHRTAFELAEDAAAENVRYIEVRYAPILHVRRGLPMTTIVHAVVQGLREAEKKLDIRAGTIICGIRNQSPENSYRLAELAVAFKNRGVIGFDLAGAEVDFPAKKHKDAFQLILNNNINCTLHAGEAYGPESIAQAIHWCGAHRIGHGTRLAEDGDLLNYINDNRIPLEVCLSSNLQTKTVPTIEAHPLRFYYDYGLRTTINTDNRLISDTTVTKELYLAHKYLGMTLDDIKELIIYGFKSAFMPFGERRELLARVTHDLGTTGNSGRYLINM